MTTLDAKPHLKLRNDGSVSVEYRAVRQMMQKAAARYPASNYNSFLSLIRESFSGAWQQNFELRATSDLLTFPPIYAAITLIASDFAKVRVRMTKLTGNVWLESEVPKTSPWLALLRKPNEFQTRVQFFSNWMTSKLIYGNTYALKQRDARGVVTDLYILDPCRTVPLVSTDGRVFYRLTRDDLSGLPITGVEVPASEIIHDRMETFWHPLVGISPLTAAAIAATQGLNIQGNAATFFQNMSRPSGILVAPGAISPEQANEIKAAWEAGYGGLNSGKTAVIGDGMTYIPLSVPADQSQLVEQMEVVAQWAVMSFHVPPYKLGLKSEQKFNNMAQQDSDYYKQCLQIHYESAEACLDDGLALPSDYRTEFDVKGLMRMDPNSRAEAASKRLGVGVPMTAINEERADEDLPPVVGAGDKPMAQQQVWPIDVLANRPPPDSTPKPPPVAPEPPPAKANVASLRLKFGDALRKVA